MRHEAAGVARDGAFVLAHADTRAEIHGVRGYQPSRGVSTPTTGSGGVSARGTTGAKASSSGASEHQHTSAVFASLDKERSSFRPPVVEAKTAQPESKLLAWRILGEFEEYYPWVYANCIKNLHAPKGGDTRFTNRGSPGQRMTFLSRGFRTLC